MNRKDKELSDLKSTLEKQKDVSDNVELRKSSLSTFFVIVKVF